MWGIVSIHAPVKGATQITGERSESECFNPRAREGRDRFCGRGGFCRLVSIHAPVKGATQHGDKRVLVSVFQSTRP